MDATRKALIIGNGFDINIGLKTSYPDFMKWLDKKQEITGSYLYHYLQERNLSMEEKQEWVDIEFELRNYSKKLSKNDIEHTVQMKYEELEKLENSRNNFRGEYIQICNLLRRYLIEQQDEARSLNLEQQDAIKILDKLSHNLSHPLQVISFNYTTILDKRPNIIMHHVHGSLDTDGFVFGIEDGEDINKQHSFLYKSYNRDLNVNYLNKKLDDAQQITFFGYSLGQTDHSYFDDFFKEQSTARCSRKSFIFYYYDQKAYDNLYWQLRTLTDKRVAKFLQFNDVSFISVKKEIAE